jgi:hypothetical protein
MNPPCAACQARSFGRASLTLMFSSTEKSLSLYLTPTRGSLQSGSVQQEHRLGESSFDLLDWYHRGSSTPDSN